MTTMFRLLVLLLVALGGPAAAEPMPTIAVSIGIYRVDAEVAYTEPTRERGLMMRNDMAAYHGMLFVFPDRKRQCMWMKNTLIPLAVAFLDEQGRIVNIEEMEAQTLNNHCSTGRIRYALEMNAGWFSQRGFAAGAMVSGLDNAPLPR